MTSASDRFAIARKAMIDSQLRTSGVNDAAVLQRMSTLAREDFVPEKARGIAYMDRAVPLGPAADGQPRYLAAPVFHGMMLQEADPRPADDVLVIEGGSAYLTELVRPLVASVTAVSPEQALAGTIAGGPFSLLLIDGAVEHVPDSLAGVLAEDGRVLTGLASEGITRLAAGRPANGAIALLPLAELGIPVLRAFARPEAWTF